MKNENYTNAKILYTHFAIRNVFTIVCLSNIRKGIRRCDSQKLRIKNISLSLNMLHTYNDILLATSCCLSDFK